MWNYGNEKGMLESAKQEFLPKSNQSDNVEEFQKKKGEKQNNKLHIYSST